MLIVLNDKMWLFHSSRRALSSDSVRYRARQPYASINQIAPTRRRESQCWLASTCLREPRKNSRAAMKSCSKLFPDNICICGELCPPFPLLWRNAEDDLTSGLGLCHPIATAEWLSVQILYRKGSAPVEASRHGPFDGQYSRILAATGYQHGIAFCGLYPALFQNQANRRRHFQIGYNSRLGVIGVKPRLPMVDAFANTWVGTLFCTPGFLAHQI